LSVPTRARLIELNTLRNKCSHNWLLKRRLRHGRRPAQKKPPLLAYQVQDLHKVNVLKAFDREYTVIYLKLYLKLD